MTQDYFSASYHEARGRFLAAARRLNADISSFPVSASSTPGLFIDVAVTGQPDSDTVMITSGVHGVEGFFGSAVQLALLESLSDVAGSNAFDSARVRHVFIHAINPYGFHHRRRCNEDNVDLNRNFPGPSNEYAGAPPGYKLHNRFLNPATGPSRLEPFRIKAGWKILRHGMASLKESIAAGQYEYPLGLFYGGRAPEQSTKIVIDNFQVWLGGTQRVVHIDLHTGLGKYGQYKLLLSESPGSKKFAWYENTFDRSAIEPLGDSSATAYPVCGFFGEWAQRQHSDLDYRVIGAEFGSYDVVRVLAALRAENRAYHFSNPATGAYKAAKSELTECFCPSDNVWRSQVVASGLDIIRRASVSI